MTDDIHVADITVPDDSTNLRQPDHDDPPRSSSPRGRLPGRSAQLVDHPYKRRYWTPKARTEQPRSRAGMAHRSRLADPAWQGPGPEEGLPVRVRCRWVCASARR